jgi:hypothetical protein
MKDGSESTFLRAISSCGTEKAEKGLENTSVRIMLIRAWRKELNMLAV